jgi:hypothetical protein
MSVTAEREARRTALILAASQAIVGSAAPIAISLGALAGYYLLGDDKSLATAPVTGFNVGVALGAIPAASIIRRVGGNAPQTRDDLALVHLPIPSPLMGEAAWG